MKTVFIAVMLVGVMILGGCSDADDEDKNIPVEQEGLEKISTVNYTVTINSNSNGTTDPTPGEYSVAAGSQFNVLAIPNSGYYFSFWLPSYSSNNPISITVDSNRVIQPHFYPYQIVTVTSAIGGTTNPATGAYEKKFGDQFTITATPSVGYVFSHWSGSVSGSSNPLTTTINSNTTITPNFVVSNWTVSVNSATGGTTNPGVGNHTVGNGGQFTITATPSVGYAFSHWSGSVSGSSNPLTTTVTSNATIIPNFVVSNWTVSVNSATGGTTNPSVGNYTVGNGGQFTIAATPSPGYVFSHWSGSVSGSSNPLTTTVTSNATITPNFVNVSSINLLDNGSVGQYQSGSNWINLPTSVSAVSDGYNVVAQNNAAKSKRFRILCTTTVSPPSGLTYKWYVDNVLNPLITTSTAEFLFSFSTQNKTINVEILSNGVVLNSSQKVFHCIITDP